MPNVPIGINVIGNKILFRIVGVPMQRDYSENPFWLVDASADAE